MSQQLYFSEHEGTVSTVARHPEQGFVCVSFKVDEHRVGAPDRDGVDLLSVSGVTETRPTCERCAPDPAPTTRAARSSDPD